MSLNDGYVYSEEIGRNLDLCALEYLADRYRHSSVAEWEARFARGEVEIDGVRAHGTERLRPGQVLSWHRPPWHEEATPQTFEVVYEDEHLVAVVKPSGLPTLPAGGFLKNTLLHLLQARWAGAIPLHRLGRATSGLVLVARTRETAARLSGSWREGLVEKRYRALCEGRAARDDYEIAAPIGLVHHPRLGSVYGACPTGKPSHSTAQVLERRSAHTLFEVQIHTGRPEQIRIHLAFIDHPLVGDPLFAVGGVPRLEAPGLPGDGGYLLHAASLAFTHPVTGVRLRLHAAPPTELRTSSGD